MIRSRQTTVPLAQGTLGLSGSVFSPYFQTSDLRKIDVPDRNINIFLVIMKAFVNSPSLAADPLTNDLCVGVNTQFRTGTVWNGSSNIPLIGFTIETDDYVATATAAVIAYALSAFSTTITAADIIWPTHLIGMANRSEGTISLAVQTSTGAVGTQVSTTNDALVTVDLSSVTTASIAGNAAVDLVLEVAPTNSATAGDWVVKGRTGNAQALSLAVTLQSIQTLKGQTIAYVPKGYFVKVRSTGSTGTVSTSVVEARTVLL